MPTIIDKLLNRDAETKPSAEELRQIADLAQEETTRLAQLIDQARRELEAKAGMQESIKSVESRISSADGTLKAFEQRATAAREMTEEAAELEGRIGTLDQLVTSADARIRQVEARNGKLSEARASIEKLISSNVEADAKVASFKNQAKAVAGVQGDVQRVKGGLDQLEEQFGLIRDDYERLQDTISTLRKEHRQARRALEGAREQGRHASHGDTAGRRAVLTSRCPEKRCRGHRNQGAVAQELRRASQCDEGACGQGLGASASRGRQREHGQGDPWPWPRKPRFGK